jgi:hypothetical protein
MKKMYLKIALAGVLVAASPAVIAQCTFTPTVTPNDMMLCPNQIDSLWTQQYDSYQWYKDGVAIANETRQFLPVEQYQDAGSLFSVEATLNNCMEMSAEVMVDGWVFMLPFMSSSTNEGWVSSMGEQEMCQGDVLTIELMPAVYDINFQWYRDGEPISGANAATYQATQTGAYIVTASPSICPDYVANPGVAIELIVHVVEKPVIDQMNDTLFVSLISGNQKYQWYKNGVKINGATNNYHKVTESAAYSVTASLMNGKCEKESDPVNITISSVENLLAKHGFKLYPNPSKGMITIDAKERATYELLDLSGRLILSFEQGPGSAQLDVSHLEAGIYLIKAISSGNAQIERFIRN